MSTEPVRKPSGNKSPSCTVHQGQDMQCSTVATDNSGAVLLSMLEQCPQDATFINILV